MRKELIVFASLLSILYSCGNTADKKETKATDSTRTEKFEPADVKAIVFAGQELEAIGGLAEYNDGYFDHFPHPGGFTMYTDFLTGINSFGYLHKGLDGLTTTDNWGDGPSNMSVQIADADFKNSTLAIGLDFSQGHDSIVARGGFDTLIIRLAGWLKTLANRPVFLRIGYEFDGLEWNHYTPKNYVSSFRRIRRMLDSSGVNNVAYVWQSRGANANLKDLNEFYPGDDYVDWCAYSFFTPAEEHHPMLQFARQHNKPLFLAEATPVLPDASGKPIALNLANAADANRAWNEWFIPYFRTIKNNPDVVKAFHYINANWKSRPMWKKADYFKSLDARLHLDDTLATRWKNEVTNDRYLNASDTLFNYLWNK